MDIMFVILEIMFIAVVCFGLYLWFIVLPSPRLGGIITVLAENGRAALQVTVFTLGISACIASFLFMTRLV